MKTAQDENGANILISCIIRLVLLFIVSALLVIGLDIRAGDPAPQPIGVEMSWEDIKTYEGLIDSQDIIRSDGVYYVKEYTIKMRIDTIRELSSGVKQITGYDVKSNTNILVNMNFITDFRVVDYSQGTMVEITNLVRKTNDEEVLYTTTSLSEISK